MRASCLLLVAAEPRFFLPLQATLPAPGLRSAETSAPFHVQPPGQPAPPRVAASNRQPWHALAVGVVALLGARRGQSSKVRASLDLLVASASSAAVEETAPATAG